MLFRRGRGVGSLSKQAQASLSQRILGLSRGLRLLDVSKTPPWGGVQEASQPDVQTTSTSQRGNSTQ